MTFNPFELGPQAFLTLYASLLAVAVIIGFMVPARMRPSGSDKTVTDPDELALLTAGRFRFIDSIVANMLSTRSLSIIGKNSFAVLAADRAQSQAERSVVSLPPPIKWNAIAKTLYKYAIPIERRLVANGQMMDADELRSIRLWALLSYLILLALGLVRLVLGIEAGRPVGFLTALLIATAIFALIRFAFIDRRTRSGIAAADSAQMRHERLKRAPTTEETALAVALFGTGVIAASGFGDFHRMRSGDGGSSGGSDGGSGCSGGGCGGGGCGG